MAIPLRWPRGFVVGKDDLPEWNMLHADLHGVAWDQRPIPRRWHWCKATTLVADFADGVVEWIERCACGGIRIDGEQGSWCYRNSRTDTSRNRGQHA